MATPDAKVHVDYFSDVLCVWAYVSQIRLNELVSQFGEQVSVKQHFVTLFGNTHSRIAQGWADRGGYAGFNQHVLEVCEKFPEVKVCERVWLDAPPMSSGNSHLFLKAVQMWMDKQGIDAAIFDRIVWDVRCKFFLEARDIGTLDVLFEVLEAHHIPTMEIERLCMNGAAMADLCEDLSMREQFKLEGSPTYLLNEGRQKLYGNVGYRIIEANVQELLDSPEGMASWC